MEGFEVDEIDVGDTTLTVAIAETLEQRSQGLGEVESLPAGLDGMLFVFGEERPATFGMADTVIPLDIWWFDGDGTLIGSTTMEPCPEASCPSYPSPGEVSWALETLAGEWRFAPGAALVPPG
ncbi:MAG TPA: DUF192 domain-containing protein [Acidimicrobiia bacterium]|nr:DUF192 domain-containing protein [Acidimicrobiia bacterium]